MRTLQVALPESVGEELRFYLAGVDARIVEQTAAEPANGERLWTLEFDRYVKGQLLLFVNVETPRGEETQFSLHTLRIIAAERQNGYVVIEAGAEQGLSIETADSDRADARPLVDVDPVDLPASGYQPRERIVAAYRYVMTGYRVSLTEDRFDRQPVPTALCYQSSITRAIVFRYG